MTAVDIGPLEAGLDVTGSILDGIAADQWDLPSPCTEWSVRQVAEHLTGGNDLFTRALGGEGPPSSSGAEGVAKAYHESAERLLIAFRQPGVMEKVVQVPFGTVPGAVALRLRLTEVLVHGWDLARATGQTPRFPEEATEEALAFTVPMLERIPPGRQPFGPPQPVDRGAPAIDRLAACLGRTVSRAAGRG
ncbi:MAG: TIGR03086 family metal-binding protein [Candidatus Dormibacteria bacterium]